MALAFVAIMYSWGLSHKLQIATAINFNYDLLLLPYLPREQKLIVYKQKVDMIWRLYLNFQCYMTGMSAKVHCSALQNILSSIRKDAEYSSNSCVHL